MQHNHTLVGARSVVRPPVELARFGRRSPIPTVLQDDIEVLTSGTTSGASRVVAGRHCDLVLGLWKPDHNVDMTFNRPMIAVHLDGFPGPQVYRQDHWSERSTPGCISIIPPKSSIKMRFEAEIELLTLHFTSEHQEWRNVLSRFHYAIPDSLAVALGRAIASQFSAHPASFEQDYVRTLVASLEAHVLAGQLLSSPTAASYHQPKTYRSRHAIDAYISNNLTRKIEISEFTELLRMSASSVLRLFKDYFHLKPSMYIRKQKILRACELLHTSSLSTSEIALMLGFSSQAHFCDAFKKWTTETPSTYRARANKQNVAPSKVSTEH